MELSTEEMERLLSGLNEPQREAVTSTRGPLLIIAGAGSGKTSVLTRRMAYLLKQERVAPWSILAITFTNKAAKEMKERVARLVGQAADEMWVSTFHAMCVRILRREIDKLGFTSQFTILDAGDQLSAVRRCCEELNYDQKKFEPRSLAAAISQYKNVLVAPDTALKRAETVYEEAAAQVYKLYQTKLRAQNSLDFDDLILLTVQLFEQYPAVLDYYQAKFQYIHVDEYQDTNHSQYRLVRLLADRYRNLCVVGDSDQSIYKWRGADIGNILSFEQDYPDAKVIKLEQNYRSTKRILTAANAVIENNLERPKKTLWTANSEGERLYFYRAFDEREEARFIVDEVHRRRQLGELAYSDVAVLYRTNAQSRAIEEMCLKSGVPYRVFGGIKFYERKEIKDLLGYLRLIANPADDLAFIRIVNVPKRGIGEGTIARMAELAAKQGTSLFTVTQQMDMLGLSGRFVSAVEGFASLIRQLAAQQDYLTVTELTEELLLRSGYREMLKSDRTIEGQARLENVEEFLSVTQEYEKRNPTGGLIGFLTDVALVADSEQEGGSGDGITLMTLHSAKGLEFPVVFLVGMEEGVFPHARSATDEREMEEERRLCYVGITRAQKELYLTCANTRMLFGQTKANPPSRFLQEIPQEVLVDVKKATGSFPRIAREGMAVEQTPKSFGGDLTENWSVGDRVLHRKWGEGLVLARSGTGEDLELTIEFAAPTGTRKLMVKYAPIVKAGGQS
ncbi:DNA helicase PcrA [Sulfoacidibacillus thermotolerans]|uniref:ATP-dependent DNA helicase n=1 Tax=Sulfoacidibacillus thermotolerans TaxID=1765684 RepID=A0A2U3D7J4_SULT2|nr:DNA helicase PcrA [Sulfoacidibacillus thermotolerans]PWI57266.1 ATP-dependent DNA helicase PcrA [Sulfoacidibacillus thermotolerans]